MHRSHCTLRSNASAEQELPLQGKECKHSGQLLDKMSSCPDFIAAISLTLRNAHLSLYGVIALDPIDVSIEAAEIVLLKSKFSLPRSLLLGTFSTSPHIAQPSDMTSYNSWSTRCSLSMWRYHGWRRRRRRQKRRTRRGEGG